MTNDKVCPDEADRSRLNIYFSLLERGSNVRTEVVAGITTFMTMGYIIVVNAAILGDAGMPMTGVAIATCLAAAFGSILMGMIADYPLALAPGMALNAYFAYTVVNGMHLSWQVALGSVFLSGVAFLLLTLMGVRQLVVNAIPRPLFAAIGASVGLFVAFIGLRSAGIVVADPATLVTMGKLNSATPLLALFGLVFIAILEARQVKAAILIGIVATTALSWMVGAVATTPHILHVGDLAGTALRLDIKGALGLGDDVTGVLEILFVFLFVDLFSNIGTLVAVVTRIDAVGPDGEIPRINRILMVDSLATIFGALVGTSTVTSYVESAAGVSSGGRTGLTAIVTGLLFLLALPFAPLVQAVPAAATAPALILVGGMMIGIVVDIDWKDPVIGIPSFLTLVVTPLTLSIVDGLAMGVVMHAVLLIACRRFTRENVALLALAIIFAARFAYVALR